jgi:dTDP-4-dehydrorhamnose reductase
MKLMVLGTTGMLGHKLLQVLDGRFDLTGTVRGSAGAYRGHPLLGQATLLGGVQAEDFDSVVRTFAAVRPDAVVNAIGLIKQLPGAKDPLPSLTLNSLFPHRLAQLCQAAGARLIHISTDCVFSGRKGRYTEADVADAEDLYGRTKFLGEVAGPGCLTLRTSIIGRELATRSGLIEWFLAQRGGRVKGYARAIYSGLTTLVLAELIGHVLAQFPQLEGVWQVSSEPISKYELLQLANRACQAGVTIERDEATVCDRSLCGDRFRQATGYMAPTWPEMISGLAADPTPYEAIRQVYAH